MAENEQKQAKPAGQPVKKRRFFRPKPKAKPEAEAKPIIQKANKSLAKSKSTPKPGNEQEKLAIKLKAPDNTKPAKPKASKPKMAKPAAKEAAKALVNGNEKLHKLDQANKPAHKTTAKTNSTFKPRRPKGTPKLRLSDIDFKYLDTPEFKDIYALVIKAKEYFATDKETCCAKFRIANEAIIERLIKDLQLDEAVAKKELSTNYFEQINLLAKKIPEDMVEGNVFAEMHNIRMIGNSFAHGDDKYDADRGSKTCLIAMEKICQWLVVFEPKYLSYQRAKDMTKSNFFSDIWNGILSIFKSK